jgi:hypothetical protein
MLVLGVINPRTTGKHRVNIDTVGMNLTRQQLKNSLIPKAVKIGVKLQR